MNANSELAGRILSLAHDEIKPDMQRILDIIADYKIDYRSGLEGADFERIIKHFIGAKKAEGISDRTVPNYTMYLLMFADYIRKNPSDINSGDVRDFVMYLTDTRKMKPISAQAVINILRSFFGWMFVEELIPRNPMTRIKSFNINKKDARHPLSIEELEKLRNACKDYRERAIIEFFYSTGCRLSEAVQIDLNSMDFRQRSIDVIGKGNRPRTLLFSIRTRLMIEEYVNERQGGTALFCSIRQPYDRLQGAAIQRIVKNIGNRAGITKRVHPHVLRHTFATNMVNAGMELTTVQRLLGHESVGTTEIYLELSQDNLRHEYDKFIA